MRGQLGLPQACLFSLLAGDGTQSHKRSVPGQSAHSRRHQVASELPSKLPTLLRWNNLWVQGLDLLRVDRFHFHPAAQRQHLSVRTVYVLDQGEVQVVD